MSTLGRSSGSTDWSGSSLPASLRRLAGSRRSSVATSSIGNDSSSSDSSAASGLAGCKSSPLFKRGASSCSSQRQRQQEPWGLSPGPSGPTYLPTHLPINLVGCFRVELRCWASVSDGIEILPDGTSTSERYVQMAVWLQQNLIL